MTQTKLNSRVKELWQKFTVVAHENPKLFAYFHVVLFVSFVYLLSARPVLIALIESRGQHNRYLAEERARMDNDLETKMMEYQLDEALRANEDLMAQVQIQEKELAAYDRELSQIKSKLSIINEEYKKFFEIIRSTEILSEEINKLEVKGEAGDEAIGGY